jgi:hypothetical protein
MGVLRGRGWSEREPSWERLERGAEPGFLGGVMDDEGDSKGGLSLHYVDKEKSGPRIIMMCQAAAQQTKIDGAGNSPVGCTVVVGAVINEGMGVGRGVLNSRQMSS